MCSCPQEYLSNTSSCTTFFHRAVGHRLNTVNIIEYLSSHLFDCKRICVVYSVRWRVVTVGHSRMSLLKRVVCHVVLSYRYESAVSTQIKSTSTQPTSAHDDCMHPPCIMRHTTPSGGSLYSIRKYCRGRNERAQARSARETTTKHVRNCRN